MLYLRASFAWTNIDTEMMKGQSPLFFLLVFLLISFSARAESSPPIILVLGDSLSAAHGIQQKDGWVSLLQARLKASGYPHKVVNASVSGETTAGGKARVEKLLATHTPKVLVLALGSNDGLRGLSLNTMKDNLNSIVDIAKHYHSQVIIIGMRLPPNYGLAYTRAFHKVYLDVAEQRQLTLVPFLLTGLEDSAKHFQADQLHPTALAQAVLLDTVWPAINQMMSTPAGKQ